METLTPEQVRERFGTLFCKNFVTIVDEGNGVAQIIEQCSAKGPVEWDAVNRKRARGIIKDIFVDGTTLVMNTSIGSGEVKFGPASAATGGQALKSLVVKGDEVETTWIGLAGASVGVGACLPQAPSVIRTRYNYLKGIGGAHEVEVTVTTPKTVRLLIGMDDTDTKEKGASWVLALKLGKEMPFGTFLEHKIVQLNPEVPEKTTNCVGVAISLALKPEELPRAKAFAEKFVRENTLSEHTVMAFFEGLVIPDLLADFGLSAKSRILEREDALEVAKKSGVDVVEITGSRGAIGAVAALGCFDLGLEAAGLPEDFK